MITGPRGSLDVVINLPELRLRLDEFLLIEVVVVVDKLIDCSVTHPSLGRRYLCTNTKAGPAESSVVGDSMRVHSVMATWRPQAMLHPAPINHDPMIQQKPL